MTFALFPEEQAARIDALPSVKLPEPGAFTGFLRGTGMGVMKGLAQIPRAAGMLLSTAAVAEDAYYGGTTAQDKYFKWHDDVFNRAVDHWTPKPHEVGVAGEVAGQLLSMLPQVMISPPVAIATTQMATGEDLVRKGVDAGKAATVGAVQGATLATGIWMPILGKTGFQRAVIGGAGFNVLQGTVSRGVSGEILEGTPAAKDFQAFDGKALTLDVLLGLAFGGMAHLSPRQRAQGEAAWQRIEAWTKGMKPSDVDALATLRQAQHLNTDSSPVIPAGLADIDAHTQRMRTALDQLTQDLPVRVDDLPEARGEVDAARVADAQRRLQEIQAEADAIARSENVTELEAQRIPARPTLDDPDFHSAIESMAKETGWAEVGGRLTRTKLSEVAGDEIIGRTNWIPRAEWWPGRPKGLTEAQANEAIRKALAGEKLRVPEQRLIDYMLDYANERLIQPFRAIEDAERARINADLRAEGLDGGARDIVDADAVARAARINESAVEQAAVLYQNDDVAFNNAIKKILNEPATRQADTGAETVRSSEADQSAPRADSATEFATGSEARQLDPLRSEAERFATENPDFRMVVGKDADGNDIAVTPKQYLENAQVEAKTAAENVRLFEIAAACMLGAR